MGSNDGGKSSNISSSSSILAYRGTYNGYKKTPMPYIGHREGQNRPYVRYKTAIKGTSLVITAILDLIMGIGKAPMPYFG